MAVVDQKKPLPLWKVLHSLRGVAILGVLFSHASSVAKFSFGGYGSMENYHSSLLWILMIQIPGYCVPLFLFLSGHFLATTSHSWKAIYKRVKKLFIPFFFWSLVKWLWDIRIFFFTLKYPKWGWSLWEFLARLLTGETHIGYFFFVLVFQWYFLARWVVPLARKKPGSALAGALLLQLLCSLFNYFSVFTFNGPGGEPFVLLRFLFPLYAFYPVLGIVAGTNSKRFSRFFEKIKGFIFPAGLVAFILVFIESVLVYNAVESRPCFNLKSAYHFSMAEWKLSYELWGLLSIFLFILIFRYKVPSSRLYNTINSEAYPLFLLNGPTIMLLKFVMDKVNLLLPVGLIFVIVLFCECAVPLLVVSIIRRRFSILKWMIGE